jgi:hypothetical protein
MGFHMLWSHPRPTPAWIMISRSYMPLRSVCAVETRPSSGTEERLNMKGDILAQPVPLPMEAIGAFSGAYLSAVPVKGPHHTHLGDPPQR